MIILQFSATIWKSYIYKRYELLIFLQLILVHVQCTFNPFRQYLFYQTTSEESLCFFVHTNFCYLELPNLQRNFLVIFTHDDFQIVFYTSLQYFSRQVGTGIYLCLDCRRSDYSGVTLVHTYSLSVSRLKRVRVSFEFRVSLATCHFLHHPVS